MRQEKQFLLDEIRGHIEGSNAMVLFNYSGLGANQANDFRNEVAKVGGEVEMVRKTILVKAADELGISLDLDALPGHVGIVLAGEDTVAATKTVYKFRKDAGDKIEVIGGHFEGQVVDAQTVKQLSELPSKDEMRASLLGLFEAPMATTLATMEALLCSVCFALENKANAASE